MGVIASLACFFAYHVFWPQGLGARLDWLTVLIALAAAIALFAFRRSVVQVIAAAAAIGYLLKVFELT
jgi:chromate transporter